MTQQNSMAYLTFLRWLGTLVVVIAHLCTGLYDFPPGIVDDSFMIFCRIIHDSFSWCIPIFIMISGSLLLNKDKEITYRKIFVYIRRFLLALLLFGLFYNILKLVFLEKKVEASQIGRALFALMKGEAWEHMWYLYMIPCLYLTIPIFKKYTDHSSTKEIQILLAVLFVPVSISEVAQSVFHLPPSGFFLPPFTTFVFYMILGHYLHTARPKINAMIPAAGLLLNIVLIVLTHALIPEKNPWDWWMVDSPMTAFAGACVFLLAQNVKKVPDFMQKYSSFTFGIYLVHPFFLNILFRQFGFFPKSFSSAYLFIPAFLFVSVFSVALTYGLRLIKPLRKYVL